MEAQNQQNHRPSPTTSHTDRDWLYKKYAVECQTTAQIAKECGVSHKTISRYLHKFGIPVRNASEAQVGLSKRRSMLIDVNIE